MRYAIIGCGRISPNHIMAAKNNGLDIVAVCDIVRENSEDKNLNEYNTIVYSYKDEDDNIKLYSIKIKKIYF